MLDALVAARLLTSAEGEGGGAARVEIVHEALIGKWGRLRGWLEEDREGQRLLQALRAAARRE